jgi:hypothetical protein
MNKFKSTLLKVIPKPLLQKYRLLKSAREDDKNSKKTTKEVFSEIYRTGAWLGTSSTGLQSGLGSSDSKVVAPYIRAVQTWIRDTFPTPPSLVDIGCGNFDVSRQLLPFVATYHGLDVVPDVVAYNQKHFGGETVRFSVADATQDLLPDGDVCTIRQVLQHLSNAQILAILQRVRKFRYVVVTEHHPEDSDAVIPNIDKAQGGSIRLIKNSGVFLDKPPFSIPSDKISLLLEVPGHGFEGGIPAGVIRTCVVTNR